MVLVLLSSLVHFLSTTLMLAKGNGWLYWGHLPCNGQQNAKLVHNLLIYKHCMLTADRLLIGCNLTHFVTTMYLCRTISPHSIQAVRRVIARKQIVWHPTPSLVQSTATPPPSYPGLYPAPLAIITAPGFFLEEVGFTAVTMALLQSHHLPM